MTTNYDGLTRNIWPGTWSSGTNAPIVLDTEMRGALRSISGGVGDYLTNIPGAQIQEGMLVYVKTGYTSGATTRTGDTYYTYKLNNGESRSAITGAVPNAESNWTEHVSSGGGDLAYTHTQTVASATWTITHNLGKFPSVTVIDSADSVVIGDVVFTSVNELVVSFSGIFSGKAYLN